MSEIKVNSIKGVAASTAALTINNTDGTCTANITNNLSNRRLTINGAMTIAQRGTSSTSSGFYTVDRFKITNTGTDESPTQAQVDVASGTTPYTSGFRKALKVTNGNQTGGAGAADFIWIQHIIEAQNIATSGWNYTSSSSNITLSFWIKSSVAQDFKGYLRSRDGTNYEYPFATGSLSADTWTKVTKTIPGNSNITINNDNEAGLEINLFPFLGTDRTDSGVTENAWATYNSAGRTKDNTSTWYTTNDATLEITGVQLEVGSVATDFEHRSFGDELLKCQRYYQEVVNGNSQTLGIGHSYSSTEIDVVIPFKTTMRSTPSLEQSSGANYFVAVGLPDSNVNVDGSWVIFAATTFCTLIYATPDASITAGNTKYVRTSNASASIAFSSEL